MMERRAWNWLAAAVVPLLLLGGTTQAMGDRYEDRIEALEARIRDLESRNDGPRMLPAVTERHDSVLGPVEARESSYTTMLDPGEEENGWVDTHAQKWSHKWGGRIYGDYIMWANADPGLFVNPADFPQNYFEMRRLRLFVSGEGYGVYDYKFQVDFSTDEDSSEVPRVDEPLVEMKDMYVGIHEIPFLGYVRFGHFKAPFSLEELTSSKYITFMERALPNYYVVGREIGVAAYNHTAGQNLTWAYGVFFDGVREARKQVVNDNQGTTLVGRVTWTPWYDEPAEGRYLFHVGGGIRYTDDKDDNYIIRVRPETHENIRFIDYDGDPLNAINDYTITNLELAWVHGPLSIQAEAFGNSINTVAAGTVETYGAYVQGSYFLTGESRGTGYSRTGGYFGRVKPLENFWIVRDCIGTGAWELKTRWSFIDVTKLRTDAGFVPDGAPENGDQINNLAVGFNWYWNPYTRVMFDYWHSWQKTAALTNEADLIGIRMQIDF